MQVSRLHHIGYVVARMGPALSRFVDEGAVLVIEPIEDPIQKVTVALMTTDAGVPVELVAPIHGEDSPIAARLRRGGGLDHLCYSVQDVAATLSQETLRGSLVVCEPVFAIAFSRMIAFVQRRSGLVVEYIADEAVDKP